MENRWKKIEGEDIANFIINRMDELEMLATPEDAGRRGELKGHNEELVIIADYLRRLNEDREAEEKAWVPTYFFLTVEGPGRNADGSIVVQYEEPQGKPISREIKNLRDYERFFAARRKEAEDRGLTVEVFSSSSLDFPGEYTKSQFVIDLARAIRGQRLPVPPVDVEEAEARAFSDGGGGQ